MYLFSTFTDTSKNPLKIASGESYKLCGYGYFMRLTYSARILYNEAINKKRGVGMNKQKRLLIFSVLLVILIAGAGMLYNYLGDKVQQNNLVDEGMDSEDTDLEDNASNDETSNNDKEEADSDASGDETADNTPTEEPKKEEVKPLKPAKELRVTDIDGNEVHLSDFKGKPVVVNFWATWCSICKNEMMDFQMVYDQYKDDVEFMMVSVTDGYRETVKKASDYIDQKGYTFPVYFDTLRDAYFIYNVSAIPVTYFIDAEGNVVKSLKGGLDRMTIENNIAKILSE